MSTDERGKFVRGNDRLAAYLNDPETHDEVTAIRADMDAEDHAYRLSLAAIRRAGELTQVELARMLGVTQGVVSRTENRTDLLYSTLVAYLRAAGVEDVALTGTIGGRRIEVVLEDVEAPA